MGTVQARAGAWLATLTGTMIQIEAREETTAIQVKTGMVTLVVIQAGTEEVMEAAVQVVAEGGNRPPCSDVIIERYAIFATQTAPKLHTA